MVINDFNPVKPNLTTSGRCVVVSQYSPLPHAEEIGTRVHLVSTELFLFYEPDSLLFYSRCLHDLQGNLDRTNKGRKGRAIRFIATMSEGTGQGPREATLSIFQEHKERLLVPVAELFIYRGDRAIMRHPKHELCMQTRDIFSLDSSTTDYLVGPYLDAVL